MDSLSLRRMLVLMVMVVAATATRWSSDFSLSKPEGMQGSIRKFMNTAEPIWTYNTTMNTSVTCKVDVMYNISNATIYFNREFYYKGNKSGYPVEGTFFPEPRSREEPYAILFGAPGGPKEGYELMVYSSDNDSCAVLNVTLSFGEWIEAFWFDLRVRNSSIEAGPTEGCRKYYSNVTAAYGQTSQVLYNSSCQRILTLAPALNIRLWDLFASRGFQSRVLPKKLL